MEELKKKNQNAQLSGPYAGWTETDSLTPDVK